MIALNNKAKINFEKALNQLTLLEKKENTYKQLIDNKTENTVFKLFCD